MDTKAAKQRMMIQISNAFHQLNIKEMQYEPSQELDDTKLSSVQDIVGAIAQQCWNAGWDHRGESCEKHCVPGSYLDVEREDEDIAESSRASKSTTKVAPNVNKARNSRSTGSSRRSQAAPQPATGNGSEYHPFAAPSGPSKIRNDFGISRCHVTKSDIAILRPHWKYTTPKLYRTKGPSETEFIQLTEQEAIDWHQMKGTTYKRKEGNSASDNPAIQANLERFRKHLRVKIRKGIKNRRKEEILGRYNGSEDDEMEEDLTLYDSTEEEEEEEYEQDDKEDEARIEDDVEGYGDGIDGDEMQVDGALPVAYLRKNSTESQWSEES